MTAEAPVREEEATVDAAGVPLCSGCHMQVGEYHQDDCRVAHPIDPEEAVAELDLPAGCACRCGGRMELEDVSDVGEWKVVTWDCRCGRTFGAQVNPETNEIVNTEWQT